MSHSHPMTEAIEIPESIRAEHAEIHAALERAMEAAGRVGEAARARRCSTCISYVRNRSHCRHADCWHPAGGR